MVSNRAQTGYLSIYEPYGRKALGLTYLYVTILNTPHRSAFGVWSLIVRFSVTMIGRNIIKYFNPGFRRPESGDDSVRYPLCPDACMAWHAAAAAAGPFS